MLRFVKSTLLTISLTIVALAAITGNRAQSADTDLRPAIQEMRDEIRELRRDVKALCELLERREDRAADKLPDLPGVHIESYLEGNIALRAQASVSKMTGNEIIASIGGRPVLASEIFQRAWGETLTPEGTSLLTATKSLAAGQISEQDFRELQVLAIRKFAKDYIRTRVLSQATMASLGKTQKEKAEDTIAKLFDNYVEHHLKNDFNVTSIFEVNERLRKQGTSLLSLKDEFRDRLLADQYLREHATRVEEPPSKHPKSQVQKKREATESAITKESPISPKADDGADRARVVYFFFAKWCGPCQMMMPIIDRMRDEGFRIAKVDVDAGQELVKRFNIVVVPTLVIHAEDESVILHGVQSEETLREKLKLFKNLGTPPKDILSQQDMPSQAAPHGDGFALDRRVTVNCDQRPLSEVLEKIFRDRTKIEFRYEQPFGTADHAVTEHSDARRAQKAGDGAIHDRENVTLHVADVPVSVALQRVFDQLHLRYQLENGVLRIDIPADPKLREALQRKVSFDCDKITLKEFISHIPNDWHLGNVVVPTTVDLQTPITMHVSGSTLEAVLKLGFEQAHVRYKFTDDVFLLSPAEPQAILTDPVADEGPRARTFRVKDDSSRADPIERIPDGKLPREFRKKIGFAPAITNLESAEQMVDQMYDMASSDRAEFRSLEALIRTTIEPKSWKDSGGRGQIVSDEKNHRLVVRQSPRLQEQIAALLRALDPPRQNSEVTFRIGILEHRGDEFLKIAGIKLQSGHGAAATVLTEPQYDSLLRIAEKVSPVEPLSTVTLALGTDAVVRPCHGRNTWPEEVHIHIGKVTGRPYAWFELSGNSPDIGPDSATAVSPDLKPLLIEIIPAPGRRRIKGDRTVDDLTKVAERRFLLIKPEVVVSAKPAGRTDK